jgi:glycogen debranching enzyme
MTTSTGPMSEVTCVSGESFVVSDRGGDVVPGGDHGFFVRDTRFLSGLVLHVDGEPIQTLHGGVTGSGTATFHGFVRPARSRAVDPVVLLTRRRVVDEGLHEDVLVANHGRDPVRLELAFHFEADFAYIFDVKHGHEHEPVEPSEGPAVVFRRGGSAHHIEVAGVPPPHRSGSSLRWELEVAPQDSTRICLDVVAEDEYGPVAPKSRCDAFDHPVAGRPSVPSGPHVECSEPRMRRLHRRSCDDLHGLAVHDPQSPNDRFVAAGSPWFLTLFGRDSIWAAFMALSADPSLAAGTLRTLARRQGLRHDPDTEEEPGKILHEVRRGSLTHLGDLPPNYYGSIDATPLFVILLSEAWRWGLPSDEVEALLPHAEEALRWIRDHGDPDGDGFLEYERPGQRGLVNQGWKDSHDGIQYADGRIAQAPIALAEVQAYAYDAAIRGAELLERFGRTGADTWRGWATDLRRRFREQFWVEDDQGRYPAIALDADKQPVDASASNMGHLLLSDLLDVEEQDLVAARLTSPSLSSGWGLRTMATSAAGFNPLGYHTGSVWPHDTAIATWGLSRTGHRDAAIELLRGVLRTAPHYGYRLPELFAGLERAPGGYPVPYPVACRPQAWAAGAGPLVLRACLGLDVDVPSSRVVVCPLWPPPFASLEVRDLPLAGGRLHVRIDADGVVADVTGADLTIEVRQPD